MPGYFAFGPLYALAVRLNGFGPNQASVRSDSHKMTSAFRCPSLQRGEGAVVKLFCERCYAPDAGTYDSYLSSDSFAGSSEHGIVNRIVTPLGCDDWNAIR